jgi:hypothetical protein
MENLVVYQAINGKRRIGSKYDGGYVIIDNLEYDAYLSCGVGYEVSFDNEFINYYPTINAYAFDATIEVRPETLNEKITFYKKNIDINETDTTTNMHNIIEKYNSIFLKMDIEGFEWNWILNLPEDLLNRIKQITIECHGILNNEMGQTWVKKSEALKKLTSTHNLVHVHGNNYGIMRTYGNINIPETLELTYIRKDIPINGKNKIPFPIENLDYPNNPYCSDYILNSIPYVDQT